VKQAHSGREYPRAVAAHDFQERGLVAANVSLHQARIV
jgi:hypothetical protein